MPGCRLSATKASFSSVEKRRLRATPVITSTFENVSDIGVCLGLSLGPPASAGVRSKRGAVQKVMAGRHIFSHADYDSRIAGRRRPAYPHHGRSKNAPTITPYHRTLSMK